MYAMLKRYAIRDWRIVILDKNDCTVRIVEFGENKMGAVVYARRFNKTQQVKARIAQLCEGRQ